MTIQTRPRRRQRVASDEAHAWARHLRLANPYAKSVLLALTHYVNDEGSVTAGLSTLAEDTDLSVDTVRKRLRFLEDVGAIARFPRWRDGHGRLNCDGNGKQTTDEIRLLIDADPDEIEARARGEFAPENEAAQDTTVCADATFSPSQQQGLNGDEKSVRGCLGVGQGLHCSHPSDSFEPEPEDSPPNPPPGGSDAALAESKQESDPEHFAEFWAGFPGHRLMDRRRARDVFAALNAGERMQARAAVAHYADDLAKARRRPRDAHKWLRNRGFEAYGHAKLPEKPPPMVWVPEDDLVPIAVAHRIVDRAPPTPIWDADHGGRGIWRRTPIPPDLGALAQFEGDARDSWLVVDVGTPEFAAWRDRIAAWIGVRFEGERVFVEPHDPAVHDLTPTHPKFRLRRSTTAMRVPCRWPPRRDGTIAGEISTAVAGEQARDLRC